MTRGKLISTALMASLSAHGRLSMPQFVPSASHVTTSGQSMQASVTACAADKKRRLTTFGDTKIAQNVYRYDYIFAG